MDDSMAYPAVEAPAWKSIASWVAAISLAVIFLASGIWKITDPIGWAARVVQFQVPSSLSIPATLLLGTLNTFGGVMLLVPRFRRWGALLTGALLIIYMGYIGYHYSTLVGEECSCFPMVKRAVGPQFFIGDLAFLGLAFVAGKWAIEPHSRRSAILVLAAIAVFAGSSYGVNLFEQGGAMAPQSVTLDTGKTFNMYDGRVYLFFFDPSCGYCAEASEKMSGYQWNDVKVVMAPVVTPEYASQFIAQTGMGGKAYLTKDTAKLREKFEFGDAPYGVMLDNGRFQQGFTKFDDTEPSKTLREKGWIK